jgi:hypothetical protein
MTCSWQPATAAAGRVAHQRAAEFLASSRYSATDVCLFVIVHIRLTSNEGRRVFALIRMSWNECLQLSLKARSHGPGLHKASAPAVVGHRRPAEEDHQMTIDRYANEEALVGLLSDDGKRTRVCATVDIIHQHAAGFNDAVTYEIKNI